VRILAKFIRLLPLASYCVDATERRASAAPKATEIHKTRNPRPFTGFFFGLYMHPNRLLDLKMDSIGDAICLMVLQLLGSNLESGDRAPIVRNEINSRSCDEKRIYIKF
jgi:hypothetical protein